MGSDVEVAEADREKADTIAGDHQSWCYADAHGDCCAAHYPAEFGSPCDCGRDERRDAIAQALAEERAAAGAMSEWRYPCYCGDTPRCDDSTACDREIQPAAALLPTVQALIDDAEKRAAAGALRPVLRLAAEFDMEHRSTVGDRIRRAAALDPT